MTLVPLLLFLIEQIALLYVQLKRTHLQHLKNMNALHRLKENLICDQKILNHKADLSIDLQIQIKTAVEILSQEILILHYDLINEIRSQNFKFK